MLRLIFTKEMLIVVGIFTAVHASALLGAIVLTDVEYETNLSYYLGEIGL